MSNPSSDTPKARRPPPPLPPRGRSTEARQPPPPYSEMSSEKQQEMISEQWRSRDPRSSSMHSLAPSESARDGKRTLLLVYIHGFMGNETSFQSFPAHVHNLLTITMAETHAVHSKLYPRYKSKKKIDFAVEDFSTWLEPHEDALTDVILLGHSMGGILEVDVALLRPLDSVSRKTFRHKIIGTINFDTPFLGMHPGLVSAGIASLFRPAPEMPGVPTASTQGSPSPNFLNESAAQSSTSLSTEPWLLSSGVSTPIESQLSPTQSAISSDRPDPNYNAPFPNDVRMEKRTGWGNVWHFVNKHMEEGLTTATKQYFVSHLEFGGCLADFSGLKSRYSGIRALEDGQVFPASGRERIRFVNYYTASTGILKKVKTRAQEQDGNNRDETVEGSIQNMSLSNCSASLNTALPAFSVDDIPDVRDGSSLVMPDFSINHRGQDDAAQTSGETHQAAIRAQVGNLGDRSGVHEADKESDTESIRSMQHIDSMPIPDSDDDLNDKPGHILVHDSIDDSDDDEFVDANDSSMPPHEMAEDLRTRSESFTEQAPEITEASTTRSTTPTTLSLLASTSDLPPIADPPIEPSALDLTAYADKDSKKLAEKEHKVLVKAYQKAVKDRETAIKDRQKLIEKREKKAKQDADKAEKERSKAVEKESKAAEKQKLLDAKNQQKLEEEKRREEEKNMSGEEKRLVAEARRLREEADRMEREAARMRGETIPAPTAQIEKTISSPQASLEEPSTSPPVLASSSPKPAEATPKPTKAPKPEKAKKDRKFCLLPSDIKGGDDKCWIRVYMEGVDEVGAHCGLFFRGPQYESLVEDVGKRIREWVLEDMNA